MRKDIMPERLREEYNAELGRLFKVRINLFCYVTIAAFLVELTVAYFFFRHLLSSKDIPGIAGGLIFSVVLLLTGGMSVSVRAQKARAFFFSFLLILISILAAKAHPEVIKYLGITLVLIGMFTSTLMLPWSSANAFVIGVFTLVNFAWIYRAIGTYVNDEIFAINIVILAVAALACAVVKRSEEILRKTDFLSRKEVEEKNAVMAKELELANRIHKSLIPRSVKHELVDIAVTYLPMLYMGGDYAKFHFEDSDKLLFMLADVTGHGVSSALLVNRIHTEVERMVREKASPGKVLKSLDDFINGDFGKMGYYLSAFAGLLDFSKGELVYSNYGHPPQILLKTKDDNVVLLTPQTFLMGIGMDAGEVHDTVIKFSKGDRLVLFTDGITEAKGSGGELYGSDRLEMFVKAAKNVDVVEFNNKLMDNVNAFRQGKQDDDIFLMTIQTK
jgi:sigma-B regulation protein RsbU (phosphoserine phosphatase)